MIPKFYNAAYQSDVKIKTYGDMIKLLEDNKNPVYIPVFYITGRHEWFKIDRDEYYRQLKGMSGDSYSFPFPCYIEIEQDGEIFFHPKVKNP